MTIGPRMVAVAARRILCAAVLLLAASAAAQQYPSKPVRLIIPFAAGGPGDTVGRMVAPRLSEAWGQQVVIDNRGGANSIVGSEIASRTPPDGYTLLIVSAGFAINVTLYPKLPYDPRKDFVPVTPVTFGPSVLVVHPSLPARTLKEFLALARAKPGQLVYGSAGSGAPSSHLGMELLKTMARVNLIHVPYKSMAPGLTDLLGGQIHAAIPTINVTVPHIKAGRLRALGVTSLTRSSALPEVPTIAEQGLAGYEASNWYAILAPGGLPPAIATRIHADVTRVVQAPDLRERMAVLGMEARTMPPDEFAAFVKTEIAKWAKVIKASGARPE